MKDTFYSYLLLVIPNTKMLMLFKITISGFYEYLIIQYHQDVENIMALR